MTPRHPVRRSKSRKSPKDPSVDSKRLNLNVRENSRPTVTVAKIFGLFRVNLHQLPKVVTRLAKAASVELDSVSSVRLSSIHWGRSPKMGSTLKSTSFSGGRRGRRNYDDYDFSSESSSSDHSSDGEVGCP